MDVLSVTSRVHSRLKDLNEGNDPQVCRS